MPEAHAAADATTGPVGCCGNRGRAGWLALGVTGLLWLALLPAMRADSTINSVDRHAYGANLGWVDARADFEHGARVGEFTCAGYLYGANVGWINLGSGEPADGIYYGNDTAQDFGVNRDPSGELTGCAWGANIGWLIFTNRTATGASFDGPRVDLFTGRFSGHVFAPNVGWITLSNLFAQVKTDVVTPGVDSDGDGLPDAWELSKTGRLDRMNASSNLDGDRATDRQEYLADTDPMTGGDEFRITEFAAAADGTSGTITWTTRPTRIYRIEARLGTDPGLPWEDAASGWMLPDPGPATTRTLTATAAAQRYLRVEVAPPLAP